MDHALTTIDRKAPLAFDRMPHSIASQGACRPRTPFSPERAVVRLPGRNPEDESLAGASERHGATLLLPQLLGRLPKVDLIILEGGECPSYVRPSVHKKFLRFQ